MCRGLRDHQRRADDQAAIQRVIEFNRGVQGKAWWPDHQELFVSQQELAILNAYNDNCTNPDLALSVGYPLEGVVGNPLTAEIIFFSNNPRTDVNANGDPISFYDRQGGNVGQEIWDILERQHDFWCNWIDRDHRHDNPVLATPFEAYNIDRRFVGAFGYWSPLLLGGRSLFRAALEQTFPNLNIGDIGANEEFIGWLSQHVAFIELFNYHSRNFDQRLVDVNPRYRFPHVMYLVELIRKIARDDKLRVVCRGVDTYARLFDGVEHAAYCTYINRQRPFFSTGNVTCSWQYEPGKGWYRNQNAPAGGVDSVLAFLINLFDRNREFLNPMFG